MKMIMKSVLVIGVATLAATTLYANSSNRQGTEVVHFSARVAFTNDGVEPDASGNLQATEAMQGNADHESLSITLKGLTPGTLYSVNVITTSNSTPTDIDDFTTDGKGGAKLSFQNNGNGKKSISFPDGVLPLTGLAEVDIVNSNATPVLTATSDGATSLKYMVKKSMDDANSTGASGTVDLSASTKSAKFGLTAAGLTGGSDYILVVDGNTVQTNTASSKGTLKINLSPSPSDVLSAGNITLEDSTFTPILTTTVP